MEHFSQNDSILVRQGENCASAWIHTCSVLASAGCCRHIIEEYVRKHNRRTRVKALVSVCFTFPSSGPHASGSCTSLDKNFDADSAFKSFMLLQGGAGNHPTLFGVMSMCLYAAQWNKSQQDCIGITAMQILNCNYTNKHKNAIDALSLEIGAKWGLSSACTSCNCNSRTNLSVKRGGKMNIQRWF